jgi:2-desacetyl-2-hydroxyethyl bacteriochlorophyllide A dehydrogenase
MRAAIVPEPGNIELLEIPEPLHGEYEALVEIIACSICSGTDSHIVYDQFPMRAYPCVLGHESIGRVVEVGSAVRSFRTGDVVLRPVAVRPGEVLGGYNSMFGGFAQIGLVADAAAIIADTPRGQSPKLPAFATAQQIVPSDFDPDLAGAFITFKETLSFLHRLGVVPGKNVLILGSGTVGLSFALGAKLIGAGPVIVSGRRSQPLQAALQWGADCTVNVAQEDLVAAVRSYTGGKGADFVVEAIGDWNVLQTGIRALADTGQIGIYGVAPERVATLDWSGTPPNWALRFIQPKEEEVHQQVLDQMRLGLVDLQRFVTHRLPFDAICEGFDLVTSKQATKVSIRIQ